MGSLLFRLKKFPASDDWLVCNKYFGALVSEGGNLMLDL